MSSLYDSIFGTKVESQTDYSLLYHQMNQSNMDHLKEHIIAALNDNHISESSVTNIYVFGSWLHQTNSPDSDFDVMIVGDIKQKPTRFLSDNYFHRFKLIKIQQPVKLDLAIYSNANFEKLLSLPFMICLDCIFAPNNMILKNDIDYRSRYMESYYDKQKIQAAMNHEIKYSLGYMERHAEDENKRMIIKKLFNAIRYIHEANSLIEHRCIKYGELAHDYKVVIQKNDVDYVHHKLLSLIKPL